MSNEKVSSPVVSRTAHLNRQGRKKGVPNKTTRAAKEAIAEAFDKLGGTQALVDWAKRNDDNRKVFYSQIWPKIIPLQVGSDPGNPLNITVIELVAPQVKGHGYVQPEVELIGYSESQH